MMQDERNAFESGKIMKEVDSIIANSMQDLSQEDREKSYLDLHGVSNIIEETPALIQQSLKLMDSEIACILNEKKDAYSIAESMDPSYVHSPTFRLQFLRGDRFNSCSAATRFVKHFELKKDLFGDSKLVKDITQDDLGQDDIMALYNGYVQWLPIKDPSGRTVSILFPGQCVKEFSVETKCRVTFYLRMVAMEDEEIQKKGFICIISNVDMNSNIWDSASLDLSRWQTSVFRHGRINDALPGYQHGVHICFCSVATLSDFMFSFMIQLAVLALNSALKTRMRIHKGSTREQIMSSLQSFGIPTGLMPLSPSDNRTQNKLLEQRKLSEEKRKENLSFHSASLLKEASLDHPVSYQRYNEIEKIFYIPGRFDVMLGRGCICNNHPGNIKFRGVVDDAKFTYDKSQRRHKTIITEKIVQAIKKKGRFLKKENYGWVQIDDETARLKVSHTFRDLAKRARRNADTQKSQRADTGGESDAKRCKIEP